MTRLRSVVPILLLSSSLCPTFAGAQMPSGLGIHERVDPISGLRWVEVRDATHPAAPPRLALSTAPKPSLSRHAVSQRAICIHAGDLLRLERIAASGGTVTIAATAVTGALCGSHLHARVTLTGATVDAVVNGPGTASLMSHWEREQ